MEYIVKRTAARHTCWESHAWDGLMQDDCEGCREAAQHQCRYCGYGDVFTTHNDVAHLENGDKTMLPLPFDEWFNHPHVYLSDRHRQLGDAILQIVIANGWPYYPNDADLQTAIGAAAAAAYEALIATKHYEEEYDSIDH